MLKGIACICVVMLHCSFPGNLGKIIYGVARFAVPLFFAISGYFVYNEKGVKVIGVLPSKIKRTAAIFLGTEILYFVWHISESFFTYGSIKGIIEWLGTKFTIENIVCFILFQNTLIGDVSWFLVALIMCYLVTFLIARYNVWKKVALLSIPLLFANVLLGIWGAIIGVKIQWYWCSNFWLLGFPCYVVGFWLRMSEGIIVKLLTSRRIAICILGLGGLAVVERAVTGESQLYFSNIPFMICCFVFCLRYPDFPKDKILLKSIGSLGERDSFGVYILHPIVRDVLRIIAERIEISDRRIWVLCLPIIVIIFSILLWRVWRKWFTSYLDL